MNANVSAHQTSVRFLLDGRLIELPDVDPERTVLQFLREDLGRTGTKEGCAEGDCGACTVVVLEAVTDAGGTERLQSRAINACIQFLVTLDGKALLTVESLATDGLHPIQQAMVDCHGSQCGFCTPGFVMSLFALYKNQHRPDRDAINDALAGNLCRCTGYRPIVDAAERMFDLAEARGLSDWLHAPGPSASAGEDETALLDQLRGLRRDRTLTIGKDGRQLHAPVTLEAADQLLERYPDATLLAGGTDVGLWVSKQLRSLERVIYIGGIDALRHIEQRADVLAIGAMVTVTEAIPAIVAHYPQLEELFTRFASPPIRNSATLGGNIANGSPIGDSMPALIAIGARLVLHHNGVQRELPLEHYYLDYQKTILRPGELVHSILVPYPQPGLKMACYKVSKRHDQDISAVCAAFALRLESGRIAEVRVAYGGMAATPKRATACEASLIGQAWDEAAVTAAMAALDGDFTPMSDHRASAGYRQMLARNLLRRFHLQSTDSEAFTRVQQC